MISLLLFNQLDFCNTPHVEKSETWKRYKKSWIDWCYESIYGSWIGPWVIKGFRDWGPEDGEKILVTKNHSTRESMGHTPYYGSWFESWMGPWEKIIFLRLRVIYERALQFANGTTNLTWISWFSSAFSSSSIFGTMRSSSQSMTLWVVYDP